MAPRLIINADDFGLTPGINRAVGELYRADVLTSATLMATGPAFDDAVEIADAAPRLGVGCHVVLVDGLPVSDPQRIPTLLGSDGRSFRPSLIDFVQALLRGAIRGDDIEREATAQVEKLQRAGVAVTHLDTHKHTHLFPAVSRSLLKVAQRCSIRAIRNPFEPSWCMALGHGTAMRRLQVKLLSGMAPRFTRQLKIRDGEIATTGGTGGISATGNLNARTLRDILQALPSSGVFELCCHPGYDDQALARSTTRLRAHREVERDALLSEIPRLALHPNATELIHYGHLVPSGAVRDMRDAKPFAPRSAYGRFF